MQLFDVHCLKITKNVLFIFFGGKIEFRFNAWINDFIRKTLQHYENSVHI